MIREGQAHDGLAPLGCFVLVYVCLADFIG